MCTVSAVIQFSVAKNEAERIVLLLSLKTSVLSRQGQHQNSSHHFNTSRARKRSKERTSIDDYCIVGHVQLPYKVKITLYGNNLQIAHVVDVAHYKLPNLPGCHFATSIPQWLVDGKVNSLFYIMCLQISKPISLKLVGKVFSSPLICAANPYTFRPHHEKKLRANFPWLSATK